MGATALQPGWMMALPDSEETSVQAAPVRMLSADEVVDQVRLAQRGDNEAFGVLVKLYHARVYNFLFRMMNGNAEAEDLTQETFVRAFKAIDRFDFRCAFSTWLFTIAKRAALNHFRDTRRHNHVEIDADDHPVEDTPATDHERADQGKRLWSIARTLKPVYHEVLWLRYGEDFSMEEIGRIISRPALYVKVVLHRARTALAKKLEKEGLAL